MTIAQFIKTTEYENFKAIALLLSASKIIHISEKIDTTDNQHQHTAKIAYFFANTKITYRLRNNKVEIAYGWVAPIYYPLHVFEAYSLNYYTHDIVENDITRDSNGGHIWRRGYKMKNPLEFEVSLHLAAPPIGSLLFEVGYPGYQRVKLTAVPKEPIAFPEMLSGTWTTTTARCEEDLQQINAPITFFALSRKGFSTTIGEITPAIILAHGMIFQLTLNASNRVIQTGFALQEQIIATKDRTMLTAFHSLLQAISDNP